MSLNVRYPFAMFSVALATACSPSSVYTVTKGPVPVDDGPLSGLPFFPVRGMYRRTTVLRRVATEATLTVVRERLGPDGKPSVPTATTTVTLLLGPEGIRKLTSVRGALLAVAVSPTTESVGALISQFTALPQLADLSQAPLDTVANSMEPTAVVDYRVPYFLNATVPAFGQGSSDATFNANGSLSKASATVTPGADKLVSALTSVLPIRDVVAGVAQTALGTRSGLRELNTPRDQSISFSVSLQLQTVGSVIELTKDELAPADFPPLKYPPEAGVTFKIFPIASGPAPTPTTPRGRSDPAAQPEK